MKRLNAIISTVLATSAALATTYPVVDTGQTQAFENYAGQDAHFMGNAPSYTDNLDGTVTDNVTQLMWTQDPGTKMTYEDAIKNAPRCKTGGHTDWRLPTIKELYSLIQLNGTDPDPTSTDTSNLKPFIDDDIFKFTYGKEEDGDRIIDSQFATSTQYVSTTMRGAETMFGVNFADGRIKGYGIKDPRGRGNKTFYVLYVRGTSDYGINDFKDNGNETITDKATGLTWMKYDSGHGMDWPTALKYANEMEWAGFSDWRLPNAKELQSIIDYSRSPDTTDSAAINPIFETTAITNEAGNKDFAHYWSSSTHIGSHKTDTAVYFAFGRSLGWMTDRRTGDKTLLDVHGAGSQRSDPKTGYATNFPYGRGPQGDVIRIENMVRLVRGGQSKTVTADRTETSNQRKRPSPDEPLSKSNDFMNREDQNSDGKVTQEEFRGPTKHFKRFDKNNDGFISADEVPSGRPNKDRAH